MIASAPSRVAAAARASARAPVDSAPCASLALVDAHVHLHPCFSAGAFLDAAFANFVRAAARLQRSAAYERVLCLTESAGADAFADLGEGRREARGWTFGLAADGRALWAATVGGRRLCLVAGRQVVSAERLEVLALGTRETFPDRAWTLPDLVGRVRAAGAVAVVPWGAGKWLGRRGRVVRAVVDGLAAGEAWLGDNGGRPVFWPEPAAFAAARARGLGVLPGSDPLPLPWEARRAGSCGVLLEAALARERPAESLRDLLRAPGAKIGVYGVRQGVLRFIANQAGLRLRKLWPA